MKTFHLSLGIGGIAILSMISLFVGAGDITPASLFFSDPDMRDIFFISRVPRTLSLLLAGGPLVLQA